MQPTPARKEITIDSVATPEEPDPTTIKESYDKEILDLRNRKKELNGGETQNGNEKEARFPALSANRQGTNIFLLLKLLRRFN